ncbi:hypothetical protein DFH11DRAFT_1731125 [Phellopilus nigrolimitatus]|nr:hypothetical protein DFH11DRAFT_1731125 [Phellopilus nigrolimitatus]
MSFKDLSTSMLLVSAAFYISMISKCEATLRVSARARERTLFDAPLRASEALALHYVYKPPCPPVSQQYDILPSHLVLTFVLLALVPTGNYLQLTSRHGLRELLAALQRQRSYAQAVRTPLVNGQDARKAPTNCRSRTRPSQTVILGANGMPRGPMYDGRWSVTPSLIAIRSRMRAGASHGCAFGIGAVRAYGTLIARRGAPLVAELEMRAGGPGGGPRDVFWRLCPSSWIPGLHRGLPIARPGTTAYRKLAAERVLARREENGVMKDLFHHIAGLDSPPPPPLPQIMADASIAIIADADTAPGAVGCVFAYLFSHPEAYRKLTEEIDHTFSLSLIDTELDTHRLSEMPFLNAVKNEALRLQPALTAQLQRAYPAGSGSSGSHLSELKLNLPLAGFIPEGSAVQFPMNITSPTATRRASAPGRLFPAPETAAAPAGRFRTNRAAFVPSSLDRPMDCAEKRRARSPCSCSSPSTCASRARFYLAGEGGAAAGRGPEMRSKRFPSHKKGQKGYVVMQA